MITACLAAADENVLSCAPLQILNPNLKGPIQPAQSGQPDLDRHAPQNFSLSWPDENFSKKKL